MSKDTVSRITDAVVEDMAAWCWRPLLAVYAAVFIDAIYAKVRDGQLGNWPFNAHESGSTWPAGGTCSGCGPVPAVGSRRSLDEGGD